MNQKFLWIAVVALATVGASALDWSKDRGAVERLTAQGNTAGAIAAADELLALPAASEPGAIYDRASLIAQKGVAQLLAGKLDDAAATLAASRAVQKTHGGVISDQFTLEGRIALAKKDYAGAEKAFRRIFEDKALHDHFRSRSRFYYAELLAAQGKKVEARAEFAEVLKYKTIHPEAAGAKTRIGELEK